MWWVALSVLATAIVVCLVIAATAVGELAGLLMDEDVPFDALMDDEPH